MLYCPQIRNQRVRHMENRVTDLYKLPHISEFENVHLQTLWESCVAMEDRLEAVKNCFALHGSP